MLTLAASLLVAVAIDVPYLPQSEDLCGGAAVAMVFRYWGDVHADAQQFATLVDRHAGGIAESDLVADVMRRGWRADRFSGTIERLAEEVGRGQPVIILIQDRPRRYHFVVVTGVDDTSVLVHDPARGPTHRIAHAALLRAWQPTAFWSLAISPRTTTQICRSCMTADRLTSSEGQTTDRGVPAVAAAPEGHPTAPGSRLQRQDECDRLLDAAVGRIHRDGLDHADAALGGVLAQCPDASGPLRELAGVRFGQRRWSEAARLAERALSAGDADPYTSDVLGSSRYMLGDLAGALEAWNRIGKPRVNLISIEGVRRTRYQLISEAAALPINSMLTPERFGQAVRRIKDLPDQSSALVTYRMEPDGYATVHVAIVEQAAGATRATWTTLGAHAAVDREIAAVIPGGSGQGELWSASWRYWTGRPRVALTFAAPRFGALPGVWRVEGGWERQEYARDEASAGLLVSESHAFARLSTSDWVAANLKYAASAGLESWDGRRRAASVGGALDRRLVGDRVSLSATGRIGIPLSSERAFGGAGARAAYRSSVAEAGWVVSSEFSADAVSVEAPLSWWPAAGDGHTGEPLLRAHPLLHDGAIAGAAFGRSVQHANVEVTRWLAPRTPIAFGAAAFVDAARTSSAFGSRSEAPVQTDVGGGLRVRLPGSDRVLRVDVAFGIADHTRALTFGWVP